MTVTAEGPRIAGIGENQVAVWVRNYLRKGPDGKPVETPAEAMRRVAHHVAGAEMAEDAKFWEEQFCSALVDMRFCPNTPAMTGAGKDDAMMSACFVLGLDDSIKDIFETVKLCALVHKQGGGTGFTLDHIRPAGSLVKSTTGIASGPLSFLRVFDEATDAIKQGGTR